MFLKCTKWISAWMALAMVAPAMAADSPLDIFPGHTTVVVRVKGVKGTIDKAAAYADAVVPGTGQQLKFGAGLIGAGIKNPTLEGVDLAGDLWVGVLANKEGEPALAFGVASSDLAALEGALGEEVTFIKAGSKHGIYTDNEEFGEALEAGAKGGDDFESMADAIDEKSLAVFNKGDISIFVNIPAILEMFEAEVEMAGGLVETITQQEIPAEAAPGVNMPAIMEMMQGFAKGALQFVKDHEGITITATVSAKDIVIEEYFKVGDDSESAKLLAKHPGGDMAVLGALPADSLAYFGVQCNTAGFMKWAMEMSKAAISDEKALETIDTMTEEFAKLKLGGFAGSANLGTKETGLMHMVSVMETPDAKKLQAINTKYQKSLSGLELGGMKANITVKAGAEKAGSTPIDVVTIKYEAGEDSTPQAEMSLKMMETMYGSKGLTQRIAYLDKYMVQSVGGTLANMEAVIKGLSSSKATGSAALQATRAKLTPKANFIGMVDLPTAALKILRLVTEMEELPLPNAEMLKEVATAVNVKPSYAGVSLNVGDGAVHVKSVIPVEQAQGIAKIVMTVMKKQAEEAASDN